LAAVRWISQNLLVTGHGGVEDDFADGRTSGAESLSDEDTAVFEREMAPRGDSQSVSGHGIFTNGEWRLPNDEVLRRPDSRVLFGIGS